MTNRFIDDKIRNEMKKYGRGGELTIRDANIFIKKFRLKKCDLFPIVDDLGLKKKGKAGKAFRIIIG
jgi:hypothetical protein